MEKNNNKKETTVTLNDKGILLVGFIVIALTFALGFVVSSKRGKDVTVFTRSDLERIERCQKMEDSDVYAYKDKDGNLMIGWKRSGSDD